MRVRTKASIIANEGLKSLSVFNQLAVDKKSIGLSPKSGQQQGTYLFNDDVVPFDGTLPPPRQFHGEVRSWVPQRFEDFVA
jgi:hypothetical protein